MNIFRMVLAVVLPPLAVWDKGCGTVALVTVLTLLFWIPGAIAAMYFVVRDMQRVPPQAEERSADIFGATQSFKSQPLAAPNNPQSATPADPFAQSQPPTQHQPSPFKTKPSPWTEPPSSAPANSLDKPDNNLPASPPARPKPPWES
jgi:uncharacterized membrane protein YqaE (UPF0057 family)